MKRSLGSDKAEGKKSNVSVYKSGEWRSNKKIQREFFMENACNIEEDKKAVLIDSELLHVSNEMITKRRNTGVEGKGEILAFNNEPKKEIGENEEKVKVVKEEFGVFCRSDKNEMKKNEIKILWYDAVSSMKGNGGFFKYTPKEDLELIFKKKLLSDKSILMVNLTQRKMKSSKSNIISFKSLCRKFKNYYKIKVENEYYNDNNRGCGMLYIKCDVSVVGK